MQKISAAKEEPGLSVMPPHLAVSWRGTAIQLGLSHFLAGVVALSLSFWLSHLHLQPSSTLLIALAGAGICGLLCTLNLPFSLSLLERTLARLAHGQPQTERHEENRRDRSVLRWPLGALFQRVHEAELRLERCITQEQLTAEMRAKALQQASEAAAQAERNRIARDLHDSIKQQIFSMSVSAAAARTLWQQGNAEEAHQAVENIQHSAKEAQVEMQALLQQLRSAPLEHTSLVDALGVQAQALGSRTGARVQVKIGPLPGADLLLPGTHETIFRLVQEAFANIAKHARARTVWLGVQTQEQALRIEVRDDGQGFDPATTRHGMGLSNLRERVGEVHGRVEISSQVGQGTTVLIHIPVLEALGSPEEQALQRYELRRATEQIRWRYHLCTNASFLGLVTSLAYTVTSNQTWGLVALGGFLVACYSYISGVYSRARVTVSAGRESRTAVELWYEQYQAQPFLLGLIALGAGNVLKQVGLLSTPAGVWLSIAINASLMGSVLVLRRFSARDIERYYTLFTPQERRREVARHMQVFTRTMICCCCVLSLVVARFLSPVPPHMPALQEASVLTAMLLAGVAFYTKYLQIRRWKQRLGQGEEQESVQEKEQAYV